MPQTAALVTDLSKEPLTKPASVCHNSSGNSHCLLPVAMQNSRCGIQFLYGFQYFSSGGRHLLAGRAWKNEVPNMVPRTWSQGKRFVWLKKHQQTPHLQPLSLDAVHDDTEWLEQHHFVDLRLVASSLQSLKAPALASRR